MVGTPIPHRGSGDYHHGNSQSQCIPMHCIRIHTNAGYYNEGGQHEFHHVSHSVVCLAAAKKSWGQLARCSYLAMDGPAVPISTA